jgi:hypothetical protein
MLHRVLNRIPLFKGGVFGWLMGYAEHCSSVSAPGFAQIRDAFSQSCAMRTGGGAEHRKSETNQVPCIIRRSTSVSSSQQQRRRWLSTSGSDALVARSPVWARLLSDIRRRCGFGGLSGGDVIVLETGA